MLDISYCSDMYQYTMGKSFYEEGRKDKKAIFNLFFRQAPDNNNWAVVSGIQEAIKMIKAVGNKPEDYFEQFLPSAEYKEFRKYLSTMKFTGNVYCMQEGEIVFPREPVMIIEAPIIEAQILETPLLCIMNHQMAVATKASRVSRSTDKPISEFGSRRAHGPWAAMHGGKAAFIGGCVSSSNILSHINFGVPCSGTMAHSYITSFGSTIEGEYNAFNSYINTHTKEPIILLIDTYDTLHCGLRNAIEAFKNNNIDNDYPYGYGIRLDSGDLAYLSNECRKVLDKAGYTKCQIIATNSLDEYLIPSLERQGCSIDAYGVGDAIATSKHNPCFGNVYKLVQIDDQPVLKRSEDKVKLINPGFQITYRIIRDDSFKGDITCLRGDKTTEKIENNDTFILRDEFDSTKTTKFKKGTYSSRPLQIQMIKDGEIIAEEKSINKKRDFYINNLNHFNATEKRLINPHYYKVDISDELYERKYSLINNLVKEIKKLEEAEED
ncbi:MAG: nicotinate phosphoribosyltransferase [Bacteroidales bacterium]